MWSMCLNVVNEINVVNVIYMGKLKTPISHSTK